MASTYWIKLYHETLHDPKVMRLPDRLFRRWIEVLLLAGETNEEGVLPSIGDMAWTLRLTPEEMTDDLRDLADARLIQQEGDDWIVTRFAARQAPVSSTERSTRFRERERRQVVTSSKYRGVKWEEPLWRPMPETPGIYEITCGGTGKVYVGASRNVQQRIKGHLSEIAGGIHIMSADFDEYGPESIHVRLLEAVADEATLPDREAYHISCVAPDTLYSDAPAKRHRDWPQRSRNADATIRPTDTDAEADTESDTDADADVDTRATAAARNHNGYAKVLSDHGIILNGQVQADMWRELAETAGETLFEQALDEAARASPRVPSLKYVDAIIKRCLTDGTAPGDRRNGNGSRASPLAGIDAAIDQVLREGG